MSHHSEFPFSGKSQNEQNKQNEYSDTQSRLMQEFKRIQELEKLGATGNFPRGHLTPEDEGEIKLAIAYDPGSDTVVINFGKSVEWIGFTPDEAYQIADLLKKNADKSK